GTSGSALEHRATGGDAARLHEHRLSVLRQDPSDVVEGCALTFRGETAGYAQRPRAARRSRGAARVGGGNFCEPDDVRDLGLVGVQELISGRSDEVDLVRLAAQHEQDHLCLAYRQGLLLT